MIGFWEEFQAGNAIAALKAKLALKARVKRAGKWTALPSRELVPGDIIRIRLGDVVPADARLMNETSVAVDQSALTGESLPVKRQMGQAVFSGFVIRKGEAQAIIYATGTKSYFGKTAQLVQEAKTVSHFQGAVLKIGNYLIILAIMPVLVITEFSRMSRSLMHLLEIVKVLEDHNVELKSLREKILYQNSDNPLLRCVNSSVLAAELFSIT